MNYHQYFFECITEQQKEILIALLSDAGCEGFEEDDKKLYAYSPEEITTPTINKILEQVPVVYSQKVIKEENWNALWESGFNPVTVFYPDSDKKFTSIRADFHPPDTTAQFDILINPKMSFGTGHHATTYGMVQSMSTLDFKNKDVIDFGTGTGILSILAEKRGATHVIAIDHDDLCIQNAFENFNRNECKNIRLIKDKILIPVIKADIILANINLNVIIENIESILSVCKPQTTILLSGIYLEDAITVNTILKKYAQSASVVYKNNNWIVLQIIYT
ncbi:MAG: 50S ribosomal protein L11 methyltransferase [Ferruginibacter sp.]